MGKTVYCHFSFRRPKGKDYGLFATAFYWDEEGKKLTAQATRKLKLWENQQFVSAIQAYSHALFCIYTWQGIMKSQGITDVMLVTDNSALAGWIENPNKNKNYAAYMRKAVEPYCAGSSKEITLGIGLCDVREYEKSYKYCKESLVINNDETKSIVNNKGKRAIDLDTSKLEYKTIAEIENDNPNMPEVVGLKED